MFEDFVKFVRDLYKTDNLIPLHEPFFGGNEKKYLSETIDSTYVSSVGKYVDQFEERVAEFTNSGYAVATVNGTSALHASLKLVGVDQDSEVITQSLTFVATSNAIHYCGAKPVFIDVDKNTLGMSPDSLEVFLQEFCEIRDDGICWNKKSKRKISACIPMHTFGFPVKIHKIKRICENYNISLIEDAAESLGSKFKGKHTGTYGELACLSFNGNKIITTGGGGMILTSKETLALEAKHLTTTSKVPHTWLFEHDEIGFNYRLPNLNAALGLAQMEMLPSFLKKKRWIAEQYQEWGKANGMNFFKEPKESNSNYWLNVLIMNNKEEKEHFLNITNNNKVMTRPAWIPMHKLQINEESQECDLSNTDWLYERLVTVPSGVISD